MFTLGAFAVIFDEQGRVLLSHRRDYDLWNLPGGRVESGELPTEAVVRETKEETGLDVEIDLLVGVYGKSGVDDLVFAFRCSVVGGMLGLTNEADEHGYFDLHQLPANTVPKQVERIQDAAAATPQPVFRRQFLPSTGAFLESLEGAGEQEKG